MGMPYTGISSAGMMRFTAGIRSFCHWANSASWSSVQYGPPGGNHDARNGFAAIVQRKSRKTWLKDDLVQSASSYACLISFVPTPSCAVTSISMSVPRTRVG